MAVRNIMMPIAQGRYDRSSLSRGIALAQRLSCHLDVVFLRPDPQDSFVYTGIEPDDRDYLLADIRGRMEDQGHSAAEASRRMFGKLRNKAGLESRQGPAGAEGATGAWHQVKGEPLDAITPLARRADMTIFTPETAKYNLIAENVLEATLLRSGRPVLYLPDAPSQAEPRPALIAWDGSSACVRAISAWLSSGLPLTEAVLVHVADPHEEPPESASVREHLAWHGIACVLENRPKRAEPIGEVLVEAAADLDCGLIVMGGYSHFRNWEAVFGGVTRFMIRHAPLPLLMMH